MAQVLSRGTNVYYTYLIGWSKFNIWYYGSRVANKVSPKEDLWVKYFTSSKKVKQKINSLGQPDVVEIRKTFQCKKKCRLWETKVIQRIKAVEKFNWLNQTDNTNKFYHEGPRGKFSLEHRKKLSEAAKNRKSCPRKGKKHSEETKIFLSMNHFSKKDGYISANLGRKFSDEVKMKQRIAKLGKPSWNKGVAPSEETRLKISNTLKQKNNLKRIQQ